MASKLPPSTTRPIDAVADAVVTLIPKKFRDGYVRDVAFLIDQVAVDEMRRRGMLWLRVGPERRQGAVALTLQACFDVDALDVRPLAGDAVTIPANYLPQLLIEDASDRSPAKPLKLNAWLLRSGALVVRNSYAD